MNDDVDVQHEQFHRDGFLIANDVFPSELIRSLRQRVAEIGSGQGAGYPAGDIEYEPVSDEQSSPVVRKLNRCAENDALFRETASRVEILDILESLIGPDIKLYGSQCFMKPPGGIEKPYHQDSAYFSIAPQALVTCWIALDDVTIDNGCMCVIPGSHRLGLLDHSQAWAVGDRVDKQIPDEHIDLTAEVPLTLSAGSCSFHHSLLLHRSGPNRTNHHRRGLAIHYMSARSRWTHASAPKPDYTLLRGREYIDCV